MNLPEFKLNDLNLRTQFSREQGSRIATSNKYILKPLIIIVLLLTTAIKAYPQSYKKIHQKAIVVDTHNDFLSMVTMKGLRIEDDLTGKAHSDLNRFKKGGVDVQVFAIFCNATYGKNTAYQFANTQIDSLYAIMARNPDKIELVTNPSQLRKVVKQEKLAALMGVEGGHMIEDNLDYLDSLYKRGVRYMTLTWNNSTAWASSSADESGNKIPENKRGLNDFGKTVVKRMNALGMMVDVSHVGEQTIKDVLATSTKPVIASHSSVYALCPFHRNLKDEQIKAIAKNGGVIQLNFGSPFLDSTYFKKMRVLVASHKPEFDSLVQLKKNPLEIGAYFKQKYPQQFNSLIPHISVLLDHIDYIVKLVGVDYVGLGSDFDGILSSSKDLEDVSQFPNITKGLLERGYSKKNIKKILGGNFIRVFEANNNQAN